MKFKKKEKERKRKKRKKKNEKKETYVEMTVRQKSICLDRFADIQRVNRSTKIERNDMKGKNLLNEEFLLE